MSLKSQMQRSIENCTLLYMISASILSLLKVLTGLEQRF